LGTRLETVFDFRPLDHRAEVSRILETRPPLLYPVHARTSDRGRPPTSLAFSVLISAVVATSGHLSGFRCKDGSLNSGFSFLLFDVLRLH